MKGVKLIVGGSLKDDAAAFLDAWHRTRRDGKVRERAIAFESWEALAGVLEAEPEYNSIPTTGHYQGSM
jgi:hypothetical protein